jgi:bidirectional [NiFe] hydrogenase diaphorase subunit
VDRKAQPGGDKRFALLDAAMKKHQFRGDALLEVLHTAQELFGFLSRDLLTSVARALKLPFSRVYGVATFYHFFSLAPRGEHSCVICLGTACYVKGAGDVLAAVEQECGVKAGATSSDGVVSVLTARCLGACGIAPAVVFDNEVVGKVSAEAALTRVKGWRARGTR